MMFTIEELELIKQLLIDSFNDGFTNNTHEELFSKVEQFLETLK